MISCDTRGPDPSRALKPQRDRLFLLLLVCSGILGSLPATTRAGALEVLGRLQAISAPPGSEDSLRAAIFEDLPGWSRPEVTVPGSLVVDLGGDGPVRLIVAPMDEPGYAVSTVDSSGYLRVVRLGGSGRLFDQFQVGQRCVISTQRGRLPGVFAAPSTHLRRAPGAVAEPLTAQDLWVDAGFTSRLEAGRAGVAILDPVTLSERWIPLAGSRAAGPGLEGRAEAAALLLSLAGERPAIRTHVVVAFSAQAQAGGRGMARLVARYRPAETWLVAGFSRARLGRGACVVADTARAWSAELSRKLVRIAGKTGQVSPVAYAPDYAGMDPILPVCALGIPVRQSRTSSEIVDAADVESLAALLRKLMEAP